MNSYEAGLDYAMNGANIENCHFSYFETQEMKDSWEKGRDHGKKSLLSK